MPSKKLASSTDNLLDGLIGLSQKEFLAALTVLNRDIQRLLSRLRTSKDGTISGPTVTLKTAANMQKQIAVLFLQTYGQAARDHLKRFPQITNNVKQTYSLLADEEIAFTQPNADALKLLRRQDARVYRALSSQTQAQINKSVYSHVIGRGNIDELSAEIAGALVGHEDVRGRPLSVYSDTYAQDQIMQFHATANKAMGEQLEVDHWWYVGDTIDTTRPFCREHVGDTKTTDEWEDIGRNQSWAGKSCSDIFVCRGGYNCRHHFQAVVRA